MRVPLFLALAGALAGCSAATDGPEAPVSCGAAYPDAASSPYVLPYPAGASYVVGQGNCTDGSHSDDQAFAYDIDMPIGAEVVAARAGRVIVAEERFPDGTGVSGEENVVVVQHSDGTVGGYYHLTQNGALVGVGDAVAQGAVIGRSGNSGDSSDPHLHFEVLDRPDGDTQPVTFSNTRAHPGGLVEGQAYRAE